MSTSTERFIRVRLEPCDDTSIVCAACYGFQCEWRISGGEAGVHTACIDDIHQKRKGKDHEGD